MSVLDARQHFSFTERPEVRAGPLLLDQFALFGLTMMEEGADPLESVAANDADENDEKENAGFTKLLSRQLN